MCLENHEEKNIKDNYLLSDRMDVDEVNRRFIQADEELFFSKQYAPNSSPVFI